MVSSFSVKQEVKMEAQRLRETIMLAVDELTKKAHSEDELEIAIERIDAMVCKALNIDYNTAPSAFSYD